MPMRNSATAYGWLARTFHWLAFVLVAGMITVGLIFEDMPRGDEKTALLTLHMSFGLLLATLMIARLIWRVLDRPPALPASVPPVHATLANWGHRLLYLLIFVQMGSGMLTRLTVGPLPFFGLASIPTPFTQNRDLHEFFEEMHVFGWYVVAAVVLGHAAAALYHHFALRNAVLMRMLRGDR